MIVGRAPCASTSFAVASSAMSSQIYASETFDLSSIGRNLCSGFSALCASMAAANETHTQHAKREARMRSFMALAPVQKERHDGTRILARHHPLLSAEHDPGPR